MEAYYEGMEDDAMNWKVSGTIGYYRKLLETIGNYQIILETISYYSTH